MKIIGSVSVIIAIMNVCGYTKLVCATEHNSRSRTGLIEKKKHRASPEDSLSTLAVNSVHASYETYRSKYLILVDVIKTQNSMGTVPYGGKERAFLPIIEDFAKDIIDEINDVAIQLSDEEKQRFWKRAQEEIKRVLDLFIQTNSSGVPSDLWYRRVDFLIHKKWVRFQP